MPVEWQPVHLAWAGLANARDLGGLPTRDGRVVRHRALVRADSLCKLTPEGRAAARAYGVGRVIDLRNVAELAREPNPFAGEVSYLHAPVEDETLLDEPDSTDDGHDIEVVYRRMLDRRPDLFAAAVAGIAEAEPGTVVVHCAGGKDRTGLVVSMALAVVGVDRNAIVADYVVTDERLRDSNARWFATIADPEVLRRMRALHERTLPATLVRTLDHLESTYGGVAGYLEAGGLTAGQRDALRARLVGQDGHDDG